MTNPIEVDVEQLADKLADALLAKVPFGNLVEGPVNDLLNSLVSALVDKIEAEVKAKFHI